MVDVGTAKVNARTLAMLTEAERISGKKLRVTQGYNPGGVTASAGTHDGWGVVDISVTGWSVAIREAVCMALRTVGFAAWIRLPSQGNWPTHEHCVAMGDPGLSTAARKQVTAYRNGRNGLANNGPDDGVRGFTGVTWESYQKAHPKEEPGMAKEDADRVIAHIDQVESTPGIEGGRYADLKKAIVQVRDEGRTQHTELMGKLDQLITAVQK